MALRESRSSWRRLGFYAGSITLGVAALVAINAFRADVRSTIHRASRSLLGADLELHTRHGFPESVRAVLDSASVAGTPVSFVTRFSSMALAERSGLTRLVQVRAVSGRYPYYGEILTDPPGLWPRLGSDRIALVDPAVLIELDAVVGDTLRLGQTSFVVAGVVASVPGDVGLGAAVRPRVYIPQAYLAETELLQFGSFAWYQAYLKLAGADEAETFIDAHEAVLDSAQVGTTTAGEREEDLAEGLDNFARFLALIGLSALLLGGIGIASGVHVFVKRKLETVAVLRCLGATQHTVFGVYLLQALAMGFVGAVLGVALGLGVQAALPGVLGDFLPLEVTPALHLGPILTGLSVGAWVAVIFGLLPLLTVRDVTPLEALRRPFDEPKPRRDVVRFAVYGALAVSVVGLSLSQAPRWQAGLGFAVAIAVTAAVLWLVAWTLTRATRRFFPRRAPYVLRQGIANLFRPHNQTVTVTLTVGFGIFVLGAVHLVERNLLDQLALDARPDRPNFVVFDIQQDQRDGVQQLIVERGYTVTDLTPIVPARVAAVNDRSVNDLLADTTEDRPARWALRREYRHTYRDTLTSSEELVAGAWWDELDREGPDEDDAARVARISVEEGVATELQVEVGDRITWNVQGVLLETEITSVREVNWARFEPNFFVIFEPGVLDDAPQIFVTLTRVDDATRRAELQRDLVRRYPNISALDLSLVQDTIDTLLGKITLAVRFMALFSIAAGMIVLVGAIATSRFQRVRESVLLKTLGGRARQVTQVLATEYLALGVLAGLTGMLLAAVAGWALMVFFFELTFRLPVVPLLGLAAGAAGVTLFVGLLTSRDVARRAPLAVLREMAE
jgi:putative ABC transport system permease protein